MRHPRAQTSSSGVLSRHTLDTLFGVKGSVRLLPQSGAPKAHILLKRELRNEDALDDEPICGVARFTLVANKRFTASKGQTLFLSVEDPAVDDDAKLLYGENAVALEFDYDDESDLSEPEDDGDESEHLVIEKHAKNQVTIREVRRRGAEEMGSLPARMRKSLTRSSTYNAFAERQPANSLGFPGYPLNLPEERVFTSAAIQTEPGLIEVPKRRPSTAETTMLEPEIQLPPSPISTDNHLPQERDGFQSPDIPLPNQECEDVLRDATSQRSPSPMDLSPTSSSPSRTLVDPNWLSSPAHEQSPSFPTSSAVTTPTLPVILDLNSEERHASTGLSLQLNHDKKPTASLNTIGEALQSSALSDPPLCAVRQDTNGSAIIILDPQHTIEPPLRVESLAKLTVNRPPSDEASVLPTPLSTPTPTSRPPHLLVKQQSAVPRLQSDGDHRNKLSGKDATLSSAQVSSPSWLSSQPPINAPSSSAADVLPTPTPVPNTTVTSASSSTSHPSQPIAPKLTKPKAMSTTMPTIQPTISNPLGIRPSLNKAPPRGPRTLQAAASVAFISQAQPVGSTSTLTPAVTTATKKPVVVGAKWMPVRGAGSSNASSSNSGGASSSSSSSASASVAKSIPASGASSKATSQSPEDALSLTTAGSLASSSNSTGLKRETASLGSLLRYTPSPPPPEVPTVATKPSQAQASSSIPHPPVAKNQTKILPGFVPASTSVGVFQMGSVSSDAGPGESRPGKPMESTSIEVGLAQKHGTVSQEVTNREDGEMSDDESASTPMAKPQAAAQPGVKTKTSKRNERKKRGEARAALAKVVKEVALRATKRDVGSQTEETRISATSLKRPREEEEHEVVGQSKGKGKEKAFDNVVSQDVVVVSSVDPTEDMALETDDEQEEPSPKKAKLDVQTDQGEDMTMETDNDEPSSNKAKTKNFLEDPTEDMVMETDDERVDEPSAKVIPSKATATKANITASGGKQIMDDSSLHITKSKTQANRQEITLALQSEQLLSPAVTANGMKSKPPSPAPALAIPVAPVRTTDKTLNQLIRESTNEKAKKKKKKRKGAKDDLSEFAVPLESHNVADLAVPENDQDAVLEEVKRKQDDEAKEKVAQAERAKAVAEKEAKDRAAREEHERIAKEMREKTEREAHKKPQLDPMEMLEMQSKQKTRGETKGKASAAPLDTTSMKVKAPAASTSSLLLRMAHPLPPKPVIVAASTSYRPADPVAVPVTAPVVRTKRRRSSSHSEDRPTADVFEERSRSRGRGRSRSESRSRSRSRSRSMRRSRSRRHSRHSERSSRSRSRSRSRYRSRSWSRGHSSRRSRSWSRSRSRRSTSSIASSRSRSRSAVPKRRKLHKVPTSRHKRGRTRTRSQSRSRSRGRSRSLEQRDRRSENRTKTSKTKASDVVKVKDEPKDTRLPPQAPASTTGNKLSHTNWPATNSTARFQIKPKDGSNLEVGVQKIAFGHEGRVVAVACTDKTVRVWETKPKFREGAQISMTSSIAGVCWMEGDAGLLTLSADGAVTLHIRKLAEWDSKRLFNVNGSSAPSMDVPTCMVYTKGKIAVATLMGVKVWILTKGIWQPQRDITRSGVTALKFLPDGSALIGGCRDGLLWYCEAPNGTLRAYAFMPSGKAITFLEMHPTGTHLLVTQEDGSAHLVALRLTESKGVIEKTYTSEKVKAEIAISGAGFGAIFATNGQALVFGSTNGCALVWDRKKGSVVYGLKHPDNDRVQAMGSFNGKPGLAGMMVSGTKQGKLFWWPIPLAAPGKS